MASIRIVRRAGKNGEAITRYIVDYRQGNTRKRKKLKTREEAREFRNLVHLHAGYVPIIPIPEEDKKDKRLTLEFAIDMYQNDVTAKKSSGFRAMQPSKKKRKPKLDKDGNHITPIKKYYGTQYLDRLILRRFKEFVRIKYLDEIAPADIERFQTQLSKSRDEGGFGLKGQSVNRYICLVSAFFNKLVQWRHLSESPVAVTKMRVIKRASRTLSVQQLSMIFELAPPWMRDILFFILATAVRRSQAVSLKWGSVDFESRQIHLEAFDGFVPKDGDPNTLPLYEDLYFFLKSLHETAMKNSRAKPHNLVFVDDRREPIRPDRLTHEAIKLVRKVGVQKGAVHILRHTSLSMRHQAGVSLDAIRAIAGHSSVRTTQIYLHSNESLLRDEMARTPLFKPYWISTESKNSDS